jgi:nucleoside 2-deoxyribosyltransferase
VLTKRRQGLCLALTLSAWLGCAAGEPVVYRVYLAGPEVFLPDAIEAGKRKSETVRNLSKSDDWMWPSISFEALYPLDVETEGFAHDRETGLRIFSANVDLIDEADAVVANMVRFRGPSMDVGTAFEIGYAVGKGKPVFGYYDTLPFYGAVEQPGSYASRVRRFFDLGETATADPDGLSIERFGMSENLMLSGALEATGYPLEASMEDAIRNAARYFEKNAPD